MKLAREGLTDRASGVRQARRSVRRQHRRHFLNARQHAEEDIIE
jgi:hypothetical protein